MLIVWDCVQRSRWTTVTPPMMLSLSLLACLQGFQNSHLSLWFLVSLQVSVPRDLLVSKSGSTGTSGGSDCGRNAGVGGSPPCPASWLRIRGSEISHLESEDRCLSTCHTDQHFSAIPFGWSPAPPGRPIGSPSFHQARYNGWLKPCSTCNRVKGGITPR